MGSIVDDLRLPPDPKLGGSRPARGMPDFTQYEFELLRAMAMHLIEKANRNPSWYEVAPGIGSREDRYERLFPVLFKLAGNY